MKLPSIACLYPSSSPSPFPSSHLITAALALPSPPSLFTASSDGSILFWSLTLPSLHPTSILCGHSSPVTALAASHSNLNLLFSASSDSVLCAWSASSPHRCRIRRRIPSPPPSIVVASADYIMIGAGSEVLVLDPANLTVVRSVGVGLHVVHLSLGSGWDAVAVDDYGRVRKFGVEEGKEEMDQQAGSQEISVEQGLSDEELRVSAVSGDGKFLAVVGSSRCVVKIMDGGVEIGEVCWEGIKPLLGIKFLESGEGFVMWGGDGAAVVYRMVRLEVGFRLEVLGEIPAVGGELDERSSVRFCQFEELLVRLVSRCFVLGSSLLWKPYLSIWSIPSERSDDSRIHSCVLVGEGKFPEHRNGDCSKDGDQIHGRGVSSSMVFSEDSYTPYAAVYGFYNGEIEVVRFVKPPKETESPCAGQNHGGDSCTSELFFRGHTGAVLCLAARCISTNSLEQKIYRLLVSGSTDFTVRIWDLDSRNLLAVLHHHVAPVKQIILPSFWADPPWNNCFLSVGEDCCVALVSLETLRVERMFPGHPMYPSMVAWDSRSGYVACLCRNVLSLSDTDSVLYLWDVKSGARERKIKGAASLSMFDHFYRCTNENLTTESIVGGSTSASSLRFPFIDVPNSAQSRVKVSEKGKVAMPTTGVSHIRDAAYSSSAMDVSSHQVHGSSIHPVKSSCPFAGIAILEFDLSSLMTLHLAQVCNQRVSAESIELDKEIERLEICLLRFSLCFLHLWDVDKELDRLLMEEMDIYRPDGFYIASGVKGDRGSLTLMFPGLNVSLELWKSSSEFCAMRSLAIVSVAQRMIKLSTASSALAGILYLEIFRDSSRDKASFTSGCT